MLVCYCWFGECSLVDHFLYSLQLSAYQCIDSARRSYVLITFGGQRVKVITCFVVIGPVQTPRYTMPRYNRRAAFESVWFGKVGTVPHVCESSVGAVAL